MSSYLVAFIVSDLEFLQSEDTFHRTFARPSKVADTNMTLIDGAHILSEIGEYVSRHYNKDMEKMDQVGIPQFRAGAMENWGLVTYR